MFLHPVIVLTLLNRIARYVCTYNPCVQRQQIKIKTAKKRGRVGEWGCCSRKTSRHPFEIDCRAKAIENITNRRSLRGRRGGRQSRRRAQQHHHHTLARATPLRNRCTDLPFRKYIPSKGDGFAEKAASERTPLEFIRAYDRWTSTWHGKHEIFLASGFYHSRNSPGLFILPSAEERLKNCHVRLYAPFSFISSFHGNTSRFDFHRIVCERAFGKKGHVPSPFFPSPLQSVSLELQLLLFVAKNF